MLRAVAATGTEVGRAAESCLAVGRLVPDPLVIRIIEQRLAEDDCRPGFLLDGFPRTRRQAESLDEMLARRGTPLDLVLNLVVPEEMLVQRLTARGRADDTEEVIRQRLQVFYAETAPLLQHYQDQSLVRDVDGRGTPAEVRQRIQAVVEPPQTPPEAGEEGKGKREG